MRTSDYDFALPPELIAQHPASRRDKSRLLLLGRESERISHQVFSDLPGNLVRGDLLILNDTRVIPARLRGEKVGTGGTIEILLVEQIESNLWSVMLRPGKRVRVGTRIEFMDCKKQRTEISATVLHKDEEGLCRLSFQGTPDVLNALDAIGEIPLPPYISRPVNEPLADDASRYQTVYARTSGSVAAPTAGLHFTNQLLDEIRELGVHVHFVTLHVGLGTFAPVKAEDFRAHIMHEESFAISDETATAISEAKKEGRRILAVGTTTLRVLESAAAGHHGPLTVTRGRTRIFIYPPYSFRIVDGLITNFHLPRSTLLMLVSALAAPGKTTGRERILSAYSEAIRERYRFFSYGDAMMII